MIFPIIFDRTEKLITQCMSEKYNVSTVAVGGYKDMPLSGSLVVKLYLTWFI